MHIAKFLLPGTALAAALLVATPAAAQDENHYSAQIIVVANGYCPPDSLEADGRILSAATYRDLYGLLGNTYGGTGGVSFALPNLSDRHAVGQGQGPGLSMYRTGNAGGAAAVPLLLPNLPAHTHSARLVAAAVPGNDDQPNNAALANFAAPIYNKSTAPTVDMAAGSVMLSPEGAGVPVKLTPPQLTLRYCLVVNGIPPQRP